MKEWFRIIVFVLKQMLQKYSSSFGKDKKINKICVLVSDGDRNIELVWCSDGEDVLIHG